MVPSYMSSPTSTITVRLFRIAVLVVGSIAAISLWAYATEAGHGSQDVTGNSYNGGTSTWREHNGAIGAKDAFLSDDRSTSNTVGGRSLRMVMDDLAPAYADATIQGVQVELEQSITNGVDDAWTLRTHLGDDLLHFWGPEDRTGTATESKLVWDLTGALAWTPADVDALQVKVTTKANGATDGTWRIDQLHVLVQLNRAPSALGDAISPIEDTLYVDLLPASDADAGETLQWAIEAFPEHGSLELATSTGAYEYQPDPDFFGLDAFTYSVFDGLASSAAAVVAIDVIAVGDDAPVATDQTITLPEDLGGDIVLDALDADGDALTFFIADAPGFGALTPIADGFAYEPDPQYFGPDAFTWWTEDATGRESGVATVTIDVGSVNDLPVAQDIEFATEEDTPASIDGEGYDPVEGSPVTFRVYAPALHGTVTETGTGFLYRPHAGYSGEDEFLYVAFDGSDEGLPATATVTVDSGVDFHDADNDGDGFPNLLEWVLVTDHEDAASTPSTAAPSPIINGGFESYWLGWTALYDGALGPQPAADFVAYHTSLGQQASGGAVRLINDAGVQNLRLVQPLTGAPSVASAGAALFVDVAEITGQDARVDICYDTPACAAPFSVGLELGRNTVAVQAGRAVASVAFVAPSQLNGSLQFDNVRLDL